MKKGLYILLFATFIMILGGCSSDQKLKKEYKALIEETQDDILPVLDMKKADPKKEYDTKLLADETGQYTKEKWELKGGQMVTPAGVLCRDQDIILVDRGKDCLIQADYDGNFIKSVGETGNGPLEFVSPTGITSFQDKIYVIDAGNNRVQILTKNLQFEDEISLTTDSDSPTVYENIAVESEHTIYLCGDSLMDRSITKWKDGKMTKIGENFYGSIYGNEGQIYAVNRGNICVDTDEIAMTVVSGDNYLFQIKNDKLTVLGKLPDGLSVNAFTCFDDQLICFASSLAKMYEFNIDGEWEKTLAVFKDLNEKIDLRNYISAADPQQIFLTNPQTGEVFRIRCHTDE